MDSDVMAWWGTASISKLKGLMRVANSKLAKFTEGQLPVTRTGDYSDIVFARTDGRIIPGRRVARLDATEIFRLIREIVHRLHIFLWNMEGPDWRRYGIIGKMRPRNGPEPGKILA